MRKHLVFLLLGMLLGIFSVFAQSADEPKKKILSKTGLYFSYNYHYESAHLINSQQAYMDYLTDAKGYTFGLYRNHRLFKGFYMQPELSYTIYNGAGEQRVAMISLVPVQVQLGLHIGWIRPFIAGGGFLNMVVLGRDNQGNDIEMTGWNDRASWGYFYGAGIDFLSMVQFNVRVKQWMLNFEELQPRNFGEVSAGVSFFF